MDNFLKNLFGKDNKSANESEGESVTEMKVSMFRVHINLQ